ncbi:MAG: 50S ribosomal protein L5 [uncultured bacterium]|nr:MAG: 50S ribosomal protein L5 [uncultured bacterium]
MKNYNELYNEIVLPKMMEKFGYKNIYATPKITKVSINIGVGQGQINPKFYDVADKTLQLITGQKPSYTVSRKAISGFKLREGIKVGLVVTLRGKKMSDFIYRLIHIVLPRIRDFRGLNTNSFDRNGNYSIGLKEQIVFPEIKYDEVELSHGLQINIVTSSKNADQTKELLTLIGFPFKKETTK